MSSKLQFYLEKTIENRRLKSVKDIFAFVFIEFFFHIQGGEYFFSDLQSGILVVKWWSCHRKNLLLISVLKVFYLNLLFVWFKTTPKLGKIFSELFLKLQIGCCSNVCRGFSMLICHSNATKHESSIYV